MAAAGPSPRKGGGQVADPVSAPRPSARPCAACGGEVAADGYCQTCGAPQLSERDHWVERPASWVAAVCDRGLRHPHNEDAVALAAAPTPGSLAVLVVCDGVSSSHGSDVASLAAARAARDVLAGPAPSTTGGQPVSSVASKISSWTARMAAAAARAQEAVVATSWDDPATNPPSCTFVAAVVDGPLVVAAWIGDSRAYWLPDAGVCLQLSDDDSWAGQRIAMGVPREEAESGPHAHAITRWLGTDAPGGDPRCASVTPEASGWVLVCSDGLWNYCSLPEDLAALVATSVGDVGADPAALAGALVSWANAQGGHDNITVALARLGGSASAPPGAGPVAPPPQDGAGSPPAPDSSGDENHSTDPPAAAGS